MLCILKNNPTSEIYCSVFWPYAPRQKDKIGGPAQICLLFRNIKSTQDVKMTKMGRWTASSYTPFTSSTAKGGGALLDLFRQVLKIKCPEIIVPAGFKGTVFRDQCYSRFWRYSVPRSLFQQVLKVQCPEIIVPAGFEGTVSRDQCSTHRLFCS